MNEREAAHLALPFYLAFLENVPAIGKEYQQERTAAIEQFLCFFSFKQQEQISNLLEKGKYYPQETLKSKELQQIWRESDWTSMTLKI
ncbi:hypothetical protein [Bacillus sp. Bva_UNVM-123]|uniref:hypothetical protein n=1 Tax=Bacillus sp. Bva_UNVM-123 TaxID=2829798 RepID=UPI00391F0727